MCELDRLSSRCVVGPVDGRFTERGVRQHLATQFVETWLDPTILADLPEAGLHLPHGQRRGDPTVRPPAFRRPHPPARVTVGAIVIPPAKVEGAEPGAAQFRSGLALGLGPDQEFGHALSGLGIPGVSRGRSRLMHAAEREVHSVEQVRSRIAGLIHDRRLAGAVLRVGGIGFVHHLRNRAPRGHGVENKARHRLQPLPVFGRILHAHQPCQRQQHVSALLLHAPAFGAPTAGIGLHHQANPRARALEQWLKPGLVIEPQEDRPLVGLVMGAQVRAVPVPVVLPAVALQVVLWDQAAGVIPLEPGETEVGQHRAQHRLIPAIAPQQRGRSDRAQQNPCVVIPPIVRIARGRRVMPKHPIRRALRIGLRPLRCHDRAKPKKVVQVLRDRLVGRLLGHRRPQRQPHRGLGRAIGTNRRLERLAAILEHSLGNVAFGDPQRTVADRPTHRQRLNARILVRIPWPPVLRHQQSGLPIPASGPVNRLHLGISKQGLVTRIARSHRRRPLQGRHRLPWLQALQDRLPDRSPGFRGRIPCGGKLAELRGRHPGARVGQLEQNWRISRWQPKLGRGVAGHTRQDHMHGLWPRCHRQVVTVVDH